MTNRQRGGQPGNQNARTHGFYSKAVPPERQQTLNDADKVEGLDQEIALLRSKIALAGENSDDYHELVPGISLLSRLLHTRYKLGYNKYDKNEGAIKFIENIWQNMLPVGMAPDEAYRILHAHVARSKRAPPTLNTVEGNAAASQTPEKNHSMGEIESLAVSKAGGTTKSESASV